MNPEIGARGGGVEPRQPITSGPPFQTPIPRDHIDPRSLFVFDIETVPDPEHHAGEGFPKPPHHRVVAIAFLEAEIERDGGRELYHLREVRCGGECASPRRRTDRKR